MLFPSAKWGTETLMFRFTCVLHEKIDHETLQRALNDTIQSFDIFRCVLKRGLFWYYLEHSEIKPVVREEYHKLCAAIYDKRIKTLLFEVTYFETRINLEVSHILSDGTGATNFLTTLVSYYLSFRNGLEMPPVGFDASYNQMQEDSFSKYYNGKDKLKKVRRRRVCRLRGNRYSGDMLRVITGHLSVSALLEITHEKKSSLTAYLSACLLNSIAEDITVRQQKNPVSLCIPVNLRNYFPSQSARNFFSTFSVVYDYSSEPTDFDTVLAKVNGVFKEKLTREYLTGTLNSYTAAAHNPFAKIAPLFFKDIVLKIAYWRNKTRNTATFSNVGIIKIPDIFNGYIESFDVCTSTKFLQANAISYLDNFSVSFTTPFINSDIERRFFRMLSDLGLEITITSNTEGLEI